MELARVIGTVVASRKYPGLDGVKLLLVEPLDDALAVVGDPFVVCDPGQAGVGDTVSWIGGREAALALPETFVPVDATIVTIVDQVDARPLAAPPAKGKAKSRKAAAGKRAGKAGKAS